MVPLSPVEALGPHAHRVRSLLIEVIRSRHDRAAEAHLASGSRYSMGFGSQWRDLLDDAHEALTNCGYLSHRLSPAGYQLPVVNDCLLYVWRVPGIPDAVTDFASSPTRRNGFSAKQPDPMLFEPEFGDEPDQDEVPGEARVEHLVRAANGSMPFVLAMVHSLPGQLQSIEWAIAEIDETNKVKVHGRELIWEPEPVVDTMVSDVEAFDRGTPVELAIEPREQESEDTDA